MLIQINGRDYEVDATWQAGGAPHVVRGINARVTCRDGKKHDLVIIDRVGGAFRYVPTDGHADLDEVERWFGQALQKGFVQLDDGAEVRRCRCTALFTARDGACPHASEPGHPSP